MKKLIATLFFILLFIPQLVFADITTSLIAWYKCNEGSGTTVTDSSSGGNTGTMNGDGTWFSPGKIGTYACSFSGTSGGGVSITRFQAGTTFTYAGWIYIPSGSVNAFANIMTNGNGTGIWVQSNKIDYDAAGGGHLNNTTITRDTWHHIAVVNNASAVTFYLDGSSDGTATVAQDQFFDGFGCDSGTAAECFTGYQDDVRVYTRALSSSDITELYAYTEGGGAAASVYNRVLLFARMLLKGRMIVR